MPPDEPVIHPLSIDRWVDLEDLFGPERGANSGCWCMSLRVGSAAYKALEREGRKTAFRSVVETGPPPGLLAYQGDKAIGWCAVGPRGSFTRFQSGKASRPVAGADEPDNANLYAITCFFIRAGYRKRGLMARLAAAAIDLARTNGAWAIEACAIDPDKPLSWGEGFVGVASVFTALGFCEVARRTPRRPLMRLVLSNEGRQSAAPWRAERSAPAAPVAAQDHSAGSRCRTIDGKNWFAGRGKPRCSRRVAPS